MQYYTALYGPKQGYTWLFTAIQRYNRYTGLNTAIYIDGEAQAAVQSIHIYTGLYSYLLNTQYTDSIRIAFAMT